MNMLDVKGSAGLLTAAAIALAMALPLPALAGATAPEQARGRGSVDLSNASPDAIRTHILDTCVIQQWNVSSSPKDAYADRCGCYARRITQALSADELAAFRRNGIFNDTARPKAQAAQAACKL